MANKIKPETLDILNQGKIESDRYFLPDIKLDRKIYQECALHIENCGGKWDRKSKSHLFPKGTDKFKESLEDGETTNVKKELGAFFTPPELAARVVELADVKNCLVLEPSAGCGNLIKECLIYDFCNVDCVEINEDYIRELEDKFQDRVYIKQADFLEWKPIDTKGRPIYDRVVMNPPFLRNTWISHVQHAWDFLKDGGKLVAILPSSPNPKFYKWLEDKNYEVQDVEEGAFRSEGTMVRTVILIINK